MIAAFALFLVPIVFASAQGISQLQQFSATTSPVAGITQSVYGKALIITGVTTGECLTLDSSHKLTNITCGSGGGGTSFAYPFPSNATSTQITFSGGIVGALTGNASTANTLQTPRNINGVAFNGSSDITVNAASSTLLADNNTFGGNNTFSNTIAGSITGNAGTVTNGVYTSTFNNLFDNRLSASSSISAITTLPTLSLPYSQLTGSPTLFAYPFPSNATSTELRFNDGLISTASTTINARFELPTLPNGGLSVFGGLVSSGATTTFSGGLTYLNGNVTADLGTSIAVGELVSADFGSFTCNGSACTVDSDAITLATQTTGNYLATLSSSGSITIGNSGSENAAATANINLSNANIWTALQRFSNASSSLSSFTGTTYFGGSATSTFNSAGVLTLITPLAIASGGTNASSYTLSNGITAYDGTRLVNFTGYTLTSSGLAAANASTTNLTASGFFGIPNGANLTVDASGELAIDTTSASTSLRYYDGTAERAIYDIKSKSFTIASSTLAYAGSFGAAGTTSIQLWNPLRPITVLSAVCQTDTGTANADFHDGTNHTNNVAAGTATGLVTLSTNNTWTMLEDFKADIGRNASSPNFIICTLNYRETAD